MRRFAPVLAALAAAALFVPTAALAANVHFKSGPTFTDNGVTLTATGALAGLGNKDVTIKLSTSGIITKITCTNKGGNQAPGQNKPRVTLQGQESIPKTEIKNGNVSFSVTTVAPSPISAKAAGCPNSNWTTKIDDVRFGSATITVVQDGVVVLQKSFSL